MASTNNDSKSVRQMTQALDADISLVENEQLTYNYKSFEGPSHYSVPTHALPNAFESIFKVFQPISKKEYKETIFRIRRFSCGVFS